ncbi:hypothetical protein SKAU_G00167740 [Synaphobranchus kaupii]|uniref:Uncharacterized protein n=1 Tax=Synaphobranchus kaupii TaxID=118154 RepID=A0A9Q1FK84_SYNKA|nr:hypothetical protein SKAU_G00167740 [Synaphobranchus kaupii]
MTRRIFSSHKNSLVMEMFSSPGMLRRARSDLGRFHAAVKGVTECYQLRRGAVMETIKEPPNLSPVAYADPCTLLPSDLAKISVSLNPHQITSKRLWQSAALKPCNSAQNTVTQPGMPSLSPECRHSARNAVTQSGMPSLSPGMPSLSPECCHSAWNAIAKP